jgi:hypothetical protein
MSIDGNISDLFFNTEHDEAAVFDQSGQFKGYDDALLHDLAVGFLTSLVALGVTVPSASELVDDFQRRL